METVNIYKAIANTLRTEYSIPVYSRNTEEGFQQECFFVELVTANDAMIANGLNVENLTMRISYIPIDTKQEKNIFSVMDTLKNLFHISYKVSDNFNIPITAQDFTVTTNNCLEMLIVLEIVQEEEEAAGVILETLTTTLNKEE